MKKSLLALAALTAFAGVASAQSSVTLYGRVDLSIGRAMGTEDDYMRNGSGSRLGVRGVEDLGGGMKAIFNVEHRFDADTGAQSSVPGGTTGVIGRFWTGRSIVGLQGGWGEINLGREYTTTFLQNQLLADPWGFDTVVSAGYGGNFGVGRSGNANLAGLGGIATVRNDSAITWKFAAGGFGLQAQYAEGTDEITKNVDNPYNVNVSYGAGPFYVTFGYEKPGRSSDENIMSLMGSWNFGAFKLTGYWADGEASNGDERDSWLLGFVMPIGQAELRASYGQGKSERAGVENGKIAPLGLGYHYALSKRTTIYADYVYDSELKDNKYGYDFGLKHNF
jgi:predicted porin